MLTVACVLSDEGKLYTREHVDRLFRLVAHHMSQPFEFVCLDDSPYPGYWAKISLFEPGRFAGRVLYLDLDVTVVGGLDDLADFPAPFAIIKDWNIPGFNSSVMAWDAGAGDKIWKKFYPAVMEEYIGGDQAWIYRQFPFAKVFPPEWCVSYKKSAGAYPEDCRVIVHHGRPKPWEVE